MRRAMDLTQYVRSGRRVRPCAVYVTGKILLEGDPKDLPNEHGKKTLEDLFVTVAREPLTLGLG